MTPTPQAPSLGHQAAPRWTFDDSVERVFDDMLERSIPGYAEMRRIVADVAARDFPGEGHVLSPDRRREVHLDLGCSRGQQLLLAHERLGDRADYHGVDVSEPMLEAARRARPVGLDLHRWTVEDVDLRRGFPSVQAAAITCVLTLCFVPVEHRQALLTRARQHLLPGGRIVVVEKVLGESPDGQRLLVDLHHAEKRRLGYTDEEVARKALSLEGVLVPLTASMNEAMLRLAGFKDVEPVWRCLNFAAWTATK